jgi:lysylphosphatidylglycerol synthetase-like protein (DUF2156 family)
MPQQTRSAGARSLDPPAAFECLRQYGDHSSGFLALEPGNEFFAVDGTAGFVPYRRAGRYRFVFGGPVCETAHEAGLLDRFLEDSARAGARVVAVQVPERSQELFARRGFVLNQLGSTYTVDLAAATLDGPAMRNRRKMVRRGERTGARVLEVGVDVPDTEELAAQLDAVDERWLGPSGKSAKPLRFMVGSRHGRLGGHRRVFVVELDGEVIGYSQCVPAFGRQPGWLYDLNRLVPGSPNVGDLQVWAVMRRLQAEGAAYFHLGLTPFAELDESRSAVAVPRSRTATVLLRLLAEHGESLYPMSGAVEWKHRWKPLTVAPEYVAFPSRLRLGAVAQLLRLTNVV